MRQPRLKPDVLERGARGEDHGTYDLRTFLRPTEAFDERKGEGESSSW
jgi:hypothetical protein